MGPPLETVKKEFRNAPYYHVEIFIAKEKRHEIARQAGFADADAIGPYLRTLIDMHRDTMGVAIK